MTIVIDVGAARYGGDYSIERLINEYKPRILYAFDPNMEALLAAVETAHPEKDIATQIYYLGSAAWTYDGEIGFHTDGLKSRLTEDPGAEKVPCFDLAHFIRELDERETNILKLDTEGSEYDLLSHLLLRAADTFLTRVVVEWHDGPPNAKARRRAIEDEFSCPIQEWPY